MGGLQLKSMHDDVEKVLVSEEEIAKIVKSLGKTLTEEYADKNPLILCILKGAAPFATDLFRAMECPVEMEFVQISSYGNGTVSSGFKLKRDVEFDITNRHIIIVDDILDTGNTLSHFRSYLQSRNPASVSLCVMFDKKERRTANIEADYVGMVVPDEFLVGYGLDYAEKYRNLPYAGILKREVYE